MNNRQSTVERHWLEREKTSRTRQLPYACRRIGGWRDGGETTEAASIKETNKAEEQGCQIAAASSAAARWWGKSGGNLAGRSARTECEGHAHCAPRPAGHPHSSPITALPCCLRLQSGSLAEERSLIGEPWRAKNRTTEKRDCTEPIIQRAQVPM
ncbi:unnamed protein product [Lasius platythorax]|uniref:Uncharacterized protein n=1 Tax=Lasius platythorax TaxID=488582 RepID=A0AAV2MZR9_9HYME